MRCSPGKGGLRGGGEVPRGQRPKVWRHRQPGDRLLWVWPWGLPGQLRFWDGEAVGGGRLAWLTLQIRARPQLRASQPFPSLCCPHVLGPASSAGTGPQQFLPDPGPGWCLVPEKSRGSHPPPRLPLFSCALSLDIRAPASQRFLLPGLASSRP